MSPVDPVRNKSPDFRYIVIVGPDGCGKTTLSDGLAQLLSDRNIPSHSGTFSFSILPSLSSLLGRKQERKPEGLENAGMVRPLSRSRATLLAIWYGFDHLLGRFKVAATALSGPKLLFARSYHDFAYQRAYQNAPSSIVRLFIWLGPRPDWIIVPTRSAEAIHAAKPELTVAEIEAQYTRIRDFFAGTPDLFEIHANEGVEEMTRRVAALLKI